MRLILNAKDSLGKKFNMLTIICLIENKESKYRQSRVLCVCDCGKEKSIRFSHVKGGKIKSCGCYGVSVRITHKMSFSAEYTAWKGMKRRCYNKKDSGYVWYGERGITVCNLWINSFEKFLEDMGLRPANTSIDRIDNSKGYSKENCRWATPTEQSRNTRRNKNFTINGETKCLSEWCKIYDVPRDTVHRRIFYNNEEIISALTRIGNIKKGFL